MLASLLVELVSGGDRSHYGTSAGGISKRGVRDKTKVGDYRGKRQTKEMEIYLRNKREALSGWIVSK
jgi:hypothetical protein